MGLTNGRDDWRWSCAIITVFFCSYFVISESSAVIGSSGAFYGELWAWVERVGDVEIYEKEIIVDGTVSGSLGEIMLVIRSPVWRRSHATLEENGVKYNILYPNSRWSCVNVRNIDIVMIQYLCVIVGTADNNTWSIPVSHKVAWAAGRLIWTVGWVCSDIITAGLFTEDESGQICGGVEMPSVLALSY